MDVASVWNLQGQLFALLAVGVLLRKIGLFEDATKRVLTDLVLFVTLPCSIVLSFQFSIDKQLIQSLVFTFLVSGGVHFFCFLLSRLFFRKVEKTQQSVLRYGLLVSNAGFMGLPIVGELFGSAGLMYASIYLIPLRVLMWTVGLSIFSPAGTSKKEAALKVILHPSMVAVYLGLILMSFQFSLPTFVEKTFSSIGGCTTALSMMLIGALLAETERKHLKIDRNLLLFSFLRLVVIPLASLIAGRLLGVDPLIIGVSVILGAMPGGSSTVILAAKYGSDTVFTSKLVIVSTILSMLSIPIWCLVL
jgi:hypothetical protein